MALSVEYTDLGSAVTAALRQAIVSGELAAGDRLVETELARQFGVSRGPIRDALAALQRSGLVELRARKGSFVRSLTVTDVDEVYTLRVALESLAVRRVIEIGADHSRLPALLGELEAAHDGGDPHDVGMADMALHRAVVGAAAHTRLLAAWEQLADQTLLMMSHLSTLAREIQGPAGDHRRIVEWVAAGDPERAVAALLHHLEASRLIMMAHFDR